MVLIVQHRRVQDQRGDTTLQLRVHFIYPGPLRPLRRWRELHRPGVVQEACTVHHFYSLTVQVHEPPCCLGQHRQLDKTLTWTSYQPLGIVGIVGDSEVPGQLLPYLSEFEVVLVITMGNWVGHLMQSVRLAAFVSGTGLQLVLPLDSA